MTWMWIHSFDFATCQRGGLGEKVDILFVEGRENGLHVTFRYFLELLITVGLKYIVVG